MKKNVIITLLIASSLAVALFTVILVGGQSVEYDPWIDVNDDGKIDMKDIGQVARAFGATGTAINKTALLLELQDGLAELNATVDSLEQRVSSLEGESRIQVCGGVDFLTVDASSQVYITFSDVTFTSVQSIDFTVSAVATSGAEGVGYPVRVRNIELTTLNAALTLECWNGAAYVYMAQDDIVQVSWMAAGE